MDRWGLTSSTTHQTSINNNHTTFTSPISLIFGGYHSIIAPIDIWIMRNHGLWSFYVDTFSMVNRVLFFSFNHRKPRLSVVNELFTGSPKPPKPVTHHFSKENQFWCLFQLYLQTIGFLRSIKNNFKIIFWSSLYHLKLTKMTVLF